MPGVSSSRKCCWPAHDHSPRPQARGHVGDVNGDRVRFGDKVRTTSRYPKTKPLIGQQRGQGHVGKLDVIIKNGRIIDGSGSRRFRGDPGIEGVPGLPAERNLLGERLFAASFNRLCRLIP